VRPKWALEKECLVEGFKIKWPNDIYFENKKLAGVLLENQMQSGNQSVVIGVGINYSIDQSMVFEIPWTDLAKITKTLPDIKLLTVEIINTILVMSEQGARCEFKRSAKNIYKRRSQRAI